MQAYYETETEISANHQLRVQLPESIPPGKARITVTYEIEGESTDAKASQKKRMADFLASLPDNATGGLSLAEIQAHIDRERSDWDD
jgi:hypothetical protein